MKPNILIAALVLLLSISFTACSNNEIKLNPTNTSIPSNNEISNISNTPSTSTVSDTNTSKTASSITSDSKKASSLPQTPSDNIISAVDTALKAYKEVLQNKVEFFSTDNKKNVYLNDFLTNKEVYGTVFKVTQFTVLDMDGDKIPEVVLELTVDNYVEFYEVLHYMNGEVYGYIQVLRGLKNLKADGTFGYSNSAFNNGYGKLRFGTNASEIEILGYHNSSQNNDVVTRTYFINNEPVTEEAYNSFTKEQDEKKDVVWYEFSQNNIEAKLSVGSFGRD